MPLIPGSLLPDVKNFPPENLAIRPLFAYLAVTDLTENMSARDLILIQR
jgi:hypothetical protein